MQPIDLIRPSSLGRVKLCPGSIHLAAKLPEPPSSEAADEGTDLHKRLPPHVSIEDLTEEQRSAVMKARAYIARMTEGASEILYEQELPAVGGMTRGGKADVVGIFPDSVTVIDLKFGRAELSETFITFQVFDYGEGARLKYGKPIADVYVYQPREMVEGDGRVTEETRASERIAEVIKYALAHPKEFHPSSEACRYCPALPWCASAEREIKDLYALAPPLAELEATPAKLARYIELSKIVEPWAIAVRQAAKEAMRAGAEIPGWELKERAGPREITSPKKAWGILKEHLPVEKLVGCMSLKVTACEEEYVKAHQNGGTKKAAIERFNEIIGPVVTRAPQEILQKKKGTS